jgi:hypothetical protein
MFVSLVTDLYRKGDIGDYFYHFFIYNLLALHHFWFLNDVWIRSSEDAGLLLI